MSLKLRDFSPELYAALEADGDEVPDERRGKFVMIADDRDKWVVMSPKEFSPYHANVVDRFCREHKIVCRFSPDMKLCEITDPDWTVLGGGHWTIDIAAKRLVLHGGSKAYGDFPRHGLLEGLRSLPELASYRVEVQ